MRKLNIIFLLFFCVLAQLSYGQVYDVLVLENFDTRTNLSKTGGNWYHETPTCSTVDMFEVSANMVDPTDVTDYVNYETGSIFAGFDLDDASVGSPTELIIFNYTADHNDHISFAGRFAFGTSCGAIGFTVGDKLDIYYSTDGGSSWSATPVLTFTGTDGGASVSDDYFTCSDGSANVQNDFLNKEFAIGSGLSGQTIKVKVVFTGFTAGGEGFFFDEFKLVRTRNILATENFDNTTNLTSSSGAVFNVENESATCANNDMYHVTSAMATPANAYNCEFAEDGNFFVISNRGSVTGGVSDLEELVMLTYTATNDNEISFRGNFATFGDDANIDNIATVQYSTDNGGSYTTGLVVTGSSGVYSTFSDGSPKVGNYFLTKGFSLGTGHNGETIKIKVIFDEFVNGGDGLALDKFILEGSVVPVTLPIELIKFSALKQGIYNQIIWQTATEINNDYFTIERSQDGLNWEVLEKAKGAGNSTTKLSYQLIDYEPYAYTYYRLKQTDFDGKYTYSNIVSVNRNVNKIGNNEVLIYPNPVSYGRELVIAGNIKSYKLYNILGEIVLDAQSTSLGNETMINLSNHSSITSGTYFISIVTTENNTPITQKIIITE